MSGPYFIQGSGLAEETSSSSRDEDLDSLAQIPSTGEASFPLATQRQEYEGLLAELLQLRSLTHEQATRICDLEQALDQSLFSLDELRIQILEQQLLEAQLASTEEISNIQQQAIIQLKSQLARQQQALKLQFDETQQRERTFQDLLGMVEALAQDQQAELEQLRSQIVRDRVDTGAYHHLLEKKVIELRAALGSQQYQIVTLESKSLSAQILVANLEVCLEQAQMHIDALSQQPSNQRTVLNQLGAKLHEAQTALQDHHRLVDVDSPHTAVSAQQKNTVVAINDDLTTAQSKIKELEAQVSKQLTTQAMLQQACQELKEKHNQQIDRVTELESQNTDMQEQILQQAQQAREYETAVQHWKDRYTSSHHQIQRLKELLETHLSNLPPEVVVILTRLQGAASNSELSPGSGLLTSSPSLQEAQIPLPEFLTRHRNYKRRRSEG